MRTKIKSLFYNNAFIPSSNYLVHFYLKNNWFIRLPLISRFFIFLSRHSPPFRKRVCFTITNERIIEFPFILKQIKNPNAKILEVGSCESLLALHLASMGHSITAVDLNDYEFGHPNLKFIKGDICNINLPINYFDYIILVSVLEHIGLGAYGEKAFEDGDKKTLQHLKNCLKNDGRFIITVPYGKGALTKTQRVYDAEKFDDLLHGLVIEKEFYYKGLDQKYWISVAKEDLANIDSSKFTQGVALIVASKSVQYKLSNQK